MNAHAQSVASDRTRTQPGTGLLYAWLLVALFVEYARPANQLSFLQFPYFYSLVPMALLLVQSFVRGLRSLTEIFSDRIAKWVLVLLGAVTASWAASGFDHYGSLPFQATLGYVFLFILIARIVTTEGRLRGVVVILALAHFYLLAFNLNVLTDPTQRQYIAGGSFLGDGNDFSLSMCILIPLMAEIALSARNRFYQVLAWSATALIIMAIIATQSRGGTLGIAAVLAFLWWRSPRKLVSAVAIALVGGLVLLYAPTQYFQRMGSVTGGTIDGSAQGRLDAWSGAIGMGAKNPVFGIGAGQFGARWGKTAHSTYMLALAELGLLGFICSIVLVLGNIRANLKLRKSVIACLRPTTPRDPAQTLRLLDMTSAGMVGFAVAGAFLSAIYYPHIFVLTALMIAARQFSSYKVRTNDSPGKLPERRSKSATGKL